MTDCVDPRPVSIRPDGHHVVVCTDESGLTWVLARTLDGDGDPFFFELEQAQAIAEAINRNVTGTTAVPAEWFAADLATPGDPFDDVVAEVCVSAPSSGDRPHESRQGERPRRNDRTRSR